MKKSVYQSKTYLNAIESSRKIIKISESFSATERNQTALIFKKKILEAKGTPPGKELAKFKEISRNYFYGNIAATLIDSQEKMFKKKGFRKVSNHTILIDLNKTEEDLWKALEKKSARWGANYARKNNLRFEIIKEKEISHFYKLYKETAKEGNFRAENIDFLKKLRDTEISKLFTVRKGSTILAGALILIDKDYNYSILDLTSSSEKGLKLQAMPFLYWNLIKYSKTLGLDYFDLGGYDMETSKGTKMENINKFKERFGGEVMEQPIYSTSWKYPFLRAAYKKIKRFVKK